MEERIVTHDCNSEMIRALIDEHNVVVEALREIVAGRPPRRFPRKIVVEAEDVPHRS